MCEEIHVAGHHTATRQARRLTQDPTSTVLDLDPMTAIPRGIFQYETKSPPNPFPHYSTRSANAPRYATPTQILPQPPPQTMTQMEQTPLNALSSQPSSANNFRPLGPIHEDFGERLPNRSNYFYGNNLSRPLRHSDLGPKQDKDVVIRGPSSGGQKRLQYFQLYRFEKSSKDWTMADKIRINAPQDELEKRVVRGKNRIPIVDTMINIHHIHRGQINRLLEKKNNDERDRDAEWVPVLIEGVRGRGKNVLAMDVIIAKVSELGRPLTRDNWVAFADEKSDLRALIKSKGKPLNRERLNPDENLANGQKLFTDDGMPVDVKRQISEKRSLPLGGPISRQVQDPTPRTSPPDRWNNPFSDYSDRNSLPIEMVDRNYQPYTGQSNSGILHLNQVLRRPSVDNNDHLGNFKELRLDDFRRAEIADFQRVGAASKCSSEGHSSDSGPRQQSRRYPYEHSGNDNKDDVVSLFSDGNKRCSISSHSDVLERRLRKGSLTQRPLPFSLRPGSPVDRNTRAIESSVAHRDYIHSGEQQHKSDFAIVKELGNDVNKDCGSENGGCARLEATFRLRPQGQRSGGAEVHATKNLKTTNTGSLLIKPVGVATAAVILPQASLPKLELNSSFPCLPPCKEEDYTIAASEPSRISDKLTKYFTYYCSVAGCIHSASPELCDLDSRNAKTIHDGETHKVYVLDGLSKADLTAHILEAHKIAIENCRHLVDVSAYKHTPLIAEERRFIVPSVTNPGASGWLTRTRLAGHAWSDWKGLDYDIVAASGFKSWDCKNCPCKSQPRPSNTCTDTATDEGIDCAPKSNAPVDVLHRETGGSPEGPAEPPVNIFAGERWHTVDSVDAIAIRGSFDSTKQPNSHKSAKSHSCPDGQAPSTTSLMSSEVDHGASACTEGSARSISDDGSLSPQETNSDGDIDSDVSIIGRTKRRVLENIMNEVQTVLFGNFSGTLRCQSEGSESTSSSEVAKPSASFKQTSKTRSSTSAGKKRAQDHDPFSEDEGDSNQKRHKKTIPASMAARARLLACPFNKHNPKIYSPCNEGQDLALQFRTCGGPGWPTVHRVKEHLYRVHPTPIQCKRCWLTMKTEKELEEHVRAQEPCLMQPQPVQWVPRDKVEALKDRKKARQGQNEEERWNYVYGLLFPEDLSLPSPYYDDSEDRPQDDRPKSPSSRNLAAFEKFSQENLPRRIREAFEAMLNEHVLPIEESLKMALPEVVRSCQAQIFRDWERFGSQVGPKTARDTLHETIEAEGTVIPGRYNAQPPPDNESLSTFFVEPAPAAIENAFDIPAHFDDYGEGPSQIIADSGYHSLRQQSDSLHREPSPRPTPMAAAGITNVCSLEDDLEDLGEINLDDPTDIDWSRYLEETGGS